MRWASRLEPHGIFKLMRAFLAPIGRHQVDAIWNNLKRALEAEKTDPAER